VQEHDITLDDLWREAEALEFDLSIQSGYLDIRKRGDTTPRYASLQPINQMVLRDAWNWLQRYRALLDQVDQARRAPAHRNSHDLRRYAMRIWIEASLLLVLLIFNILIGKLNIFLGVALCLAVLGLSGYVTIRK
jgi:hypothetical protein